MCSCGLIIIEEYSKMVYLRYLLRILCPHLSGHLSPDLGIVDTLSKSWNTRRLAPAAFIAVVYKLESDDSEKATGEKHKTIKKKSVSFISFQKNGEITYMPKMMIYKIYAHYFQQKGDQTRPMFATRNKPTRPREKHIYF